MDSGAKPTEAMYDNDARGQKAPERQPESDRLIDRQRILDRADSAFYSVVQTFLSEFENDERALYPGGDDQ